MNRYDIAPSISGPAKEKAHSLTIGNVPGYRVGMGLCPIPHLRCFFEKKHLKNP